MVFKLEITETLQRTIEVTADLEEVAFRIVKEKYACGEIVLDSSDFIAVDIDFTK